MAENLWAWFLEPTPLPEFPAWALLLPMALGALFAAYPPTWMRLRLFATWIHESGHAFAGLISGRSLTGIKVNKDSSGVTTTVGPVAGFGRLVTTFSGYPAPALAGVALVAALDAGRTRWAIAGLLVAALVLAPFQRSWRGLGITVVVAGLAWGLSQVSSQAGAVLLLVLAGFLLMASPRTIIELHRVRQATRHEPAGHSDADSLAAQTKVPAVVWEAMFLAVSLACVWWSVTTLVSHR